MAQSLSTGDGSRASPVVAFAGGGTAGHVFPGLAVAARLGRPIVWIGSSRGVEKQLAAEAGVEFHGIPAGKLRRYLSFRNLTDIMRTVAGVVSSLLVLHRVKPSLLFSKGGFVSVPPVVAAWMSGIPAWTHESDFDPGLATRINMRFCEKILVSFPETLHDLPAVYREKAIVTGNPVRAALYAADPRRGRVFVGAEPGRPLLVVIGGSLGSSFVNGLVQASLDRLLPRFFVVHQLGAKESLPDAKRNYFPAAFFREELPDILAAADLVISRAGANTLAEIAALGKPSLLIPLPSSSSRGDQVRNAAMFEARGASVVLSEEEATPEALVSSVESLFAAPESLAEMGRRAGTLGAGRPDKTIADLILQARLMFENIIGQEEAVRALRAELAAARFPRSALFFGPTYSGKLSTALETARVLTCAEGTGEWSCECPSCRMQKELAHPQTVLLGARYADVEIAASADALTRSRKPATLYLLLRAIRKLTRRFDPSIADLDDPRVKGMQDRVALLEELAAELASGAELPPARQLGDLAERIITAAAPVAAQVRADMISIGQVRRLAAWAHLTAAGSRKIAIIENADRMLDSARNSLLKLLEEPPSSVHFILLTTRRAAIIPTILSRLRPYSLSARTAEQEKEVMTRVFRRDAEGLPGLRGFFLAWREINPEKLSQLARRFMELARGPEAGVDIVVEMAELLPERSTKRGRSSRETFSSFLEELLAHLGGLLREGSAPAESLERWNAAARDAQARVESLNMQPSAVMEALYYRVRGDAG